MKKISFLLLLSLTVFAPLFSSSYRISGVEYHITGSTKPSAIDRNITIDKTRIFKDESALEEYRHDYTQQLENTRLFQELSVDYMITPPDENDLCLVTFIVTATDSFHILAMPYPKYDSNSGLNLKLKAKDTNFLGTMNEMATDFSFTADQDTQNTHPGYKFGFDFSYDYPFYISVFKSTWTNSYSASYTIGDTSPEWSAVTGIVLSLPISPRVSLDFTATQGSYRDYDYTSYGDDTYFAETGNLSLPIVLQHIDDWGDVKYTPYICSTYNWDADGINSTNSDLSSPTSGIGQTISTSRINWIHNFRTGLSASSTQSVTYNFQRKTTAPKFAVELKAYKGYTRIGFCTDIYYFTSLNTTEKIGSRLRGIKDDQYFANTSTYACATRSAVVMNFDMPFRLFRTNFTSGKILSKLNFEVQVSPFADIAFLYNEYNNNSFSYKDGFYAGGFEVIVFPEHWKSIQIRGSIGLDAGRILLKNKLNTDWRDDVSKYEIYIGVGLQY